MNFHRSLIIFFVSAMGILGCHQVKPYQSQPLETKQTAYEQMQYHQTKLLEHLEAALRQFKKTGTSDITLVPTTLNCRPKAKFSINIRDGGLTGKTIITATITNGRLSRVLGIDLIPGSPKQVKIFYKISDLSFDHEIPMIPPGPPNVLPILAEPPVTTKRIYDDFSRFYSRNDPTAYTHTPNTVDVETGYLHWMQAMLEFHDYLVSLGDYQKS